MFRNLNSTKNYLKLKIFFLILINKSFIQTNVSYENVKNKGNIRVCLNFVYIFLVK